MSYFGLKHRYSAEIGFEYVQLMQSNQMKRGNKSVTLRTRNEPIPKDRRWNPRRDRGY